MALVHIMVCVRVHANAIEKEDKKVGADAVQLFCKQEAPAQITIL